MSYNGFGTFNINTSGQPVVTGTVISSTAFNALTADLGTGLSTAITKDGQTATTARIPFAAGISSTLVTDSSSTTTGSIITAGGVGVAKALFVGTTANVAGAVTLQSTLAVGGVATYSAQPIFSSLTASSAVATDASKGLVSVTNTGTGNNVLATSPTLVTPALGTPSALVGTNITGTATAFTASNVTTNANLTGNVTSIGNATTISSAVVTPAMLTQPFTSGTAQASSGTSIDFTGIPTWVKRITVMFNGFSTSGGGNYLVQIGAGSITSSGYLSNGGYIQGTSPNGSQSSTAGYVVTNSSNTALTHGQFVLTTLGSNIWTASYSMSQTTSQFVMFGAGTITLGGTLDRVRITSAVGTDTLDAGTLNILYE
jgi:hypothetical protein